MSKSAIHRFCKKIGLKGFNELKVILAKDISEMKSDIEMIDVNYPFERKDGPQMIAKKLSKLYETAIYDTYDYMDFIELHKVAQLLHKAEVIDIYTHSHNMNVAENFQDKMLTVGKSSVECPHGFYKQRLTALASNPKHAAIILSCCRCINDQQQRKLKRSYLSVLISYCDAVYDGCCFWLYLQYGP